MNLKARKNQLDFNMIVELSPQKIIKEATTVWNQPGPEIDIVMELKKLSFKEGSIDELYVFHVLDHLFIDEAPEALANWIKVLKPNGKIFIIVDDFEYLTRAFVGGDININTFNNEHSAPAFFDHDNLFGFMVKAGFKEESLTIWYDSPNSNFSRKHFELIMSGEKNG